jgi:hypothetical protein
MGKVKDDVFEGESAAEIMMASGLKLLRGDNNRINGLIRYREALRMASDGKPYYQVFENCRDTIRTIPSLIYDIKRSKEEDVNTDGEDHCYDRDRYFFMSRPAISRGAVEKPKTRLQKYYAKKVMQIEGMDEEYGII